MRKDLRGLTPIHGWRHSPLGRTTAGSLTQQCAVPAGGAGHVCDGCEDGACGSDRHLRMDKGRALPQALQGNAGIDPQLEAEVRSARLSALRRTAAVCERMRTRLWASAHTLSHCVFSAGGPMAVGVSHRYTSDIKLTALDAVKRQVGRQSCSFAHPHAHAHAHTACALPIV